MTIEKLYRQRLQVAAACAALTVGTAIAAMCLGRAFLAPAALFAIAAVQCYRLARDSYAFDRGLKGPPAWRALVRDADERAANGYRTPEEIAAGVPPRSEPPVRP